MDLCPDSVGGGWKTKTESLTRELGRKSAPLKTWCLEQICRRSVYRLPGSPVLVSGAGTALPTSLSPESLRSYSPISYSCSRIRQS